MILLCFAGCAEKTGDEIKENIGKEASKDAVSLSMYLMSEKPVSAAQEALIEAKVNEITESNSYKIHLDLRYFTPEEYYAKLDAHLAEMKAFYDDGAVGKTEHTPVYTDENGLPSVYYPPVEKFHVDLFYFGGYDKYMQYQDAGYLANLDEEVSGSSKALASVINGTLMNQFKAVSGGYFAIPNNRAIGEYTYMLLNKDVLAATQYSVSDISSLVCDNAQDLLSLVDTTMSADFVPLYSGTGELDVLDVKYFDVTQSGLFTETFSSIGGTYNSNWVNGVLGSYPQMGDIIGAAGEGTLSFGAQARILKGYEFKGYYAEESEADKPFAVGYVKGGPEVVEMYSDDYEVVPVAMPTLHFADLYESMFGITQYSNSIPASAKILTLLNTNVELRNLLLYGVEGENYVWTDSDYVDATGKPYRVVSRIAKDESSTYVMDPIKTGNNALAYPEASQHPLSAEYMLQQNAHLRVDYIIKFSFYNGLKTGEIDPKHFTAMLAVNAEAKELYADLINAENEEQLDNAIKAIARMANSTEMQAVTSMSEKSPYAYYIRWLEANGLKQKEN